MQTVGNFLDRFKNLKAPERSVRSAVIVAVKELVCVEINDGDIKISSENTLYLSPNSAIKAVIFENKREIIPRINNILGKEQIKEIK